MTNVSVRDQAEHRIPPPARLGMLWVAWRQQRAAVLLSLGLIGLIALGLVFLRLNVVGALADAGTPECRTGGDPALCSTAGYAQVVDKYGTIASFVPLIMLALPPLLGAIVGGPLFAREFEQGTNILALTQSVRVHRWWAVKTLVAGSPLAIALLALGLVNSWALQPMAEFIGWEMTTPGFQTRGVTPAAYFLLAFGIAVTAGIVLRNTAAAIGSTMLVYVALLLVVGFFRPNYLPPVQFVAPLTADAGQFPQPDNDIGDSWQVDDYFVNSAGERVTLLFSLCPGQGTYPQCLMDQGATAEVIAYQPHDRYWPLQGIEAGITLVISGLFLGAGLVRLRRRVI